MPSPDFTQLAAQLWPESGMSKTAWLNYARTPESEGGLGLHIRTQTYYRIIGTAERALADAPVELNRPLGSIPTADEIEELPRAKGRGYLQHVHLLQYHPVGEGEYDTSLLRWSIKTNELMTRRDAMQLAYTQAKQHEHNYKTLGGFIAPGFYIGTWEMTPEPD